jgi:hypothetical protein
MSPSLCSDSSLAGIGLKAAEHSLSDFQPLSIEFVSTAAIYPSAFPEAENRVKLRSLNYFHFL